MSLLGLLVCFYSELEEMDTGLARVLLHQMIKCNQLRGFQADVQKLKSQLLDVAMQNQTLNDTLGSLSDAVVGLTTCQLESLSPEAVHGAIPTLNQVSGWAKSQVMILSSKYLMYEKVLSFHNISYMGALVTGISTQTFHSMSPRELSQIIKGPLAQHGSDLSPSQLHGILRKMMASTEHSSVMADIQGPLFKEVSLFDLWKEEGFNLSLLKDKEFRPSQALFLYELLSKKTSPSDLLRNSQLVKGVTCRQIETMKTISFLEAFSVFEKNLHLLTPYQINCLAWKFWTVSNASIPPYLLSVLPSEYLESITDSLCLPFVSSLGKVDLDHLVLNTHKKEAILQKVQECLNGSVVDEYDIDLLGNLICHLPPELICSGLSAETMMTALHQFRLCRQLSLEQKIEIRHRLTELHGSPRNWTAETALDSGPFIALLPKAELNALAEKFPDIIFQAASEATGPVPATEELLMAQFEFVHNFSTLARTSDLSSDCAEVRAPSPGEIFKLSEANVFWPVQGLQCMDPDAFTKTVELLGSVSSFSAAQLGVLKEKAKQRHQIERTGLFLKVWGPLSSWKSYHIVSLGCIATALNETEIGELDLSSVDSIAALSWQAGWSPDQPNGHFNIVPSTRFHFLFVSQAIAILQGFLEDSGQLMDDLKSFDMAGLGVHLCALNTTEVASINAIEFRLHSDLDLSLSLPLPLPLLSLAGLNKEELKALNNELMPYIQPAAIKHIPAEVFKELSPEQIAHLGPENAAMVMESQRQHLDELQLQSLQLALDGARTSIQDTLLSESTTRPSYTSLLNGP
ncbi:hypothetical protein lerEdw1_018453 [Lerista edwardsae]|nr:hypothetical protein lerEdw1_018453 [Lerista edwardsae]